MGKEELKLFTGYTILYLENPKEAIKNFGKISSKVEGYKINIQKSIIFLCISSEQNEI